MLLIVVNDVVNRRSIIFREKKVIKSKSFNCSCIAFIENISNEYYSMITLLKLHRYIKL